MKGKPLSGYIFWEKNIFNKKKIIFLIALIGMRNLLQWRGINVIDKEMKA